MHSVRFKRSVAALGSLLLAFSLVLAGPIADEASAAQAERIVYVWSCWCGGDSTRHELFLINPDGSGRKRLTDNQSFESDPTFSPDGSQIAYGSSGDAGSGIWVMNADGSNARAITTDGPGYHPTWSPDGTKIAYVSGDASIRVVNSDGSGLPQPTGIRGDSPAWSPTGQRLAYKVRTGSDYSTVLRTAAIDGSDVREVASFVADTQGQGEPEWSPDGAQIAFASTTGLQIVNSDGTGLRRLPLPYANSPAWSPDGARLVYNQGDGLATASAANGSGVRKLTRDVNEMSPDWTACQSGCDLEEFPTQAFAGRLAYSTAATISEVEALDLEDGKPVTVAGGPSINLHPDLSADGASLVLASDRDSGQMDVWLVDLESREWTRITDSAERDDQPSLSPDDSRVAFVSTRDGNPEIYVANLEGEGVRRITNNAFVDGSPSWSPDGNTLVFQSSRNGVNDLFTIGLDGQNEFQVTDDPRTELKPVWAPSGSTIAFLGGSGSSNYNLFTIQADGSTPVQLTHTSAGGIPTGLSWSPDGLDLVFARSNQFLVTSRTGGPLYVIPGTGVDPTWGPCPLSGCSLIPPDTDPPKVSSVSDRPDPFSPNDDGRADKLKIFFTLSEEAVVSVTFRNRNDRIVRSGATSSLDPGRYNIAWDGKSNAGRRVPNGTYSYLLEAQDAVGNRGTATGVVKVRG